MKTEIKMAQRQSSIVNSKLSIICVLCVLCGSVFGVGEQLLQDGSAYAITSPYEAADLFKVQTVQSANVMYLTHPDYHPQILRR